MKQKTVLCTRGYNGPRLAGRLARLFRSQKSEVRGQKSDFRPPTTDIQMDRLITACREWLESQDRPAARAAALAVIIASIAYMAVHLALKVIQGG